MFASPPAEPLSPTVLEERYGARNYATVTVELVRGEGAWLWDKRGRRFLDLMSAFSAVSHGHCHPRLVAAARDQLGKLAVVSRAYHSEWLGPFLARACQLTGMDRALPMNTGAEAVETAIKAARKWANRVKGIPEGQAEILVMDNNFHGRTTTLVGFSSVAQYREGFGPATPGFGRVPFGDLRALERAIGPNTAAVLLEPMQGEGGINIPPEGWLAAAAQLCRERRVLLLADEIQTGLGRTGALLACDHEKVRPDGLMLGKALGGGLLPVSLFLATEELMAVFEPGDHGSTFGGNALAARVGLEALDVLVEEQLAERSRDLGAYFLERLRALQHPAVKEVRGKGLFIGLELEPGWGTASDFCYGLLKQGALTKGTRDTVVRLTPPLVISRADLDLALGKIGATLDSLTPSHR